ncbi:hypothetical protein JHK82_031516 [Glycine max]|nr:hypothetical protein JHK82_031516 [Glycine max]
MAEKKDLLGRSKKKIKGDGEGFFGESSQHVSYAGIHEPIEDKMVGLKGDEYKNALLGGSDEEFSLLIEEDMDDDWNVDEEENKELENIKVEDILHMIDIGNDYFLAYFSHKEDMMKAQIEGPWLIYDHYLVVREWMPNFHPSSEALEKVVVRVRFFGLPIECYDSKIWNAIRDRIGRTMRVDQNTLTRERGKYEKQGEVLPLVIKERITRWSKKLGSLN